MKVLKTFSIYTFLGLLQAGVGFLVLPILTHYLSPEDYGIIALINTYVVLTIPFVGMSGVALVSLEYHNGSVEKSEYAKIISSSVYLPFFLLLVLLLISFPFADSIIELMEIPQKAYWLIYPLTICVIVNEIFRSYVITANKVRAFTILTLCKIFIEICLTLYLIVVLGWAWEGRVLSWLIFVAVSAVGIIVFLKRNKLLRFKVEFSYFKKIVLFGLPLILHEVGKFVIDQSDRLFLAKMVSIREMGIYSVSYQVAMILMILISAFANFFTPFLFQRLNDITHQKKVEIVRVSYLFFVLLFVALLFLSLLTPWLFSVFIGEAFQAGTSYVFWVGLGFFFWGIYILFSGYIFYLKKTSILAYLSVVNVMLNIAFNYFFIKIYGAIGAAYATCLSYLIVAVIGSVWTQRLYPMPWFSKEIYTLKNEKFRQ